MLPERENIAIAEIAVYFPAIALALYVFVRHGLKLGWIYIVVFCGLRIAGAIMTILSVKHPTSITDATWGAILGSIGLSPLLLAALGILDRLYATLPKKTLSISRTCTDISNLSNESLPNKKSIILAIRLLHIPAVLALLLAIVGGTRIASTNVSKHSSGQDFEKAGGILFLVVFLALVGLAVLTTASMRGLPSPEKRLLFAVLAALPFLAVRLLYGLLIDFANDKTFNIQDGNATVQLCMAILEEMIVVAFFLAAGMSVPPYKSIPHGNNQVPMTSKPPQYAAGPPLQQNV